MILRPSRVIEAAPEIATALEQIKGLTAREQMEVFVPAGTQTVNGLTTERECRVLTPEERISRYAISRGARSGKYSPAPPFNSHPYVFMASVDALRDIDQPEQERGVVERFKIAADIKELARVVVREACRKPPYSGDRSLSEDHPNAVATLRPFLPRAQRKLFLGK